jgi:hypothetical protein
VLEHAVFLSASVPDPKRGPEFVSTANAIAITAAVTALVHVTLGRRLLVWGGHPAITPMIWVVAEQMRVDYGAWVRLYQSQHFKDDFPEENKGFNNVVYTDDIERDRERSLRAMRERMFKDNNFDSAVFIGGMAGVIDEFQLFRGYQPRAHVIPVLSTGGAVLELSRYLTFPYGDLIDDLDYVALLHRHLNISVKEMRYHSPADQPAAVKLRLWRRKRIRKRPTVGGTPSVKGRPRK